MPPNRIPVPINEPQRQAGGPSHVRIYNGNDFQIEDRFDNELFEFPPLEKTTIPYIVAQHIFALGQHPQEMLMHCVRRFGWGMDPPAERKKKFDKLSISPVFMQLVEVNPPEPDFPTSATAERRPVGRPRKEMPQATSDALAQMDKLVEGSKQ